MGKSTVGIITYHNEYNCGATMQAYALQEAIIGLGFNTLILNYYFHDTMSEYGIRWGNPLVAAFDLLITPKRLLQHKSFKAFHRQYYKELSKRVTDENSLPLISAGCDCLVCGSDQIWNPKFGNIYFPYFLQFASNEQRRIAYAPSVNAVVIEDQYLDLFKELLKPFYAISTREETIAEQLSKLLNKKVSCVLDPVLLHDSSKYDVLIKDNKAIIFPDKFVFVYCINHTRLAEMLKVAERYAEANNMRIVYSSKINRFGKKYAKNIFTLGPIAFLSAIKNAEYVLSDSFHACAFSILYKKRFAYNFNNVRITELITKLGIESRLINEDFDYTREIDYSVAHKKLALLRKESYDYLRVALEKKDD